MFGHCGGFAIIAFGKKFVV